MATFTGTRAPGGQNKGRRRPPEALTDNQIDQLLGACSRRGAAGVRDAALIALMSDSGIRIAEALAVTVADVDLDGQEVRVANGKGEELLKADTVIAASNRTANQELFDDLRWLVDELHICGDAVTPRGLDQAISEGYLLGCRI